jgi:small subunit ribosomal protein S5
MREEESTISKLEAWQPKTVLGKKVKAGEITSIDEVLNSGLKILEPEIVEMLVPNLEIELLAVGQSKGKFGGGKGSIWKQTQKKTSEGNVIKFAAFAAVGNRNGIIGVGFGDAKETLPAREKAMRNAKLNIINIRKGCGSWDCGCGEVHSIPYKVDGKCGSVRMSILPAPKGAGLVVEKKCQKLLELAGIKDAYSRSSGQTKTRLNLFFACFDALSYLSKMRTEEKK